MPVNHMLMRPVGFSASLSRSQVTISQLADDEGLWAGHVTYLPLNWIEQSETSLKQ